jgi:glycine cleavage system H protein
VRREPEEEVELKPEELRFAKTHEWVQLESLPDGQQEAILGISAFAIEALTDLVLIDLPSVGRRVEPGQSLCEVESVKAVSDVYSPVSGTITAVNERLSENLETLSRDPYGEGWIAKIRLDGNAGLGDLMDYATYQKLCAEEEGM